MKTLYFLTFLLMVACKQDRQQIANKNIEEYIMARLDNSESLQIIAISKLKKERELTFIDSTQNVNCDLFDYKGYKIIVDSVNKVNPEWMEYNNKALDKLKSGDLIYYSTECTFRAQIKGNKRLIKYYFELDTQNKVLYSRDISEEIGTIN